jgi:hypothetical protein
VANHATLNGILPSSKGENHMSKQKEIQMKANAGETPKMFYSVLKTPLMKDGAPVYAGRLRHHPMTLEQLTRQMVRENPKYRVEEISGILSHFMDVVNHALKDGRAVHLGSLLRITPSIRGAFVDENDSFDPERHSIHIKASIGKPIQENFKNYPASALQKIDPQA